MSSGSINVKPSSIPSKIALQTISILIPVTAGSATRLPVTLCSLQSQTSTHWQVIVSLVSDTERTTTVPEMLASMGRAAQIDDQRIQFIAETSAHIGGALRAAGDAASGAFVMVLAPGDSLPADSIALFAQHLGADEAIDILYADEDVIENEIPRRPQFKPEWSPELLTAYNYFGRPTLIRRTLVLAAGSFDPNLDGACEWDLNLRLVQDLFGAGSTARVRRMPMVLCHLDPLSSTGRPRPNDPAAAEYRQVLTRHWERQGIKARVIPLRAPRRSELMVGRCATRGHLGDTHWR